jgi:hypothetical protein
MDYKTNTKNKTHAKPKYQFTNRESIYNKKAVCYFYHQLKKKIRKNRHTYSKINQYENDIAYQAFPYFDNSFTDGDYAKK